jgi:hypothetical protein
MSFTELIVAISLFCLGLREVTDEIDQGRIGYPIRRWFIDQEWIPLFIAKPIILCVACMASFWGSIIYWSIVYYQSNNFDFISDPMTYIKWIFCCTSASFVNTLFWTIRNRFIGVS